jgi:hypothetical protein
LRNRDPEGWVDVEKIGNFQMVKDIISGDLQQPNSLQDLKKVVDEGATPVFVLNLLTPGKDFYESPQGWDRSVDDTVGSSDWYAMLDARYSKSKSMLIKANDTGIPVNYIELGNEYYIAASPYNNTAYPDGVAYATAANYIANKIANDTELSFLSNYLLSVPGVAEELGMASDRILTWNDEMVPYLNRDFIDAISLHTYQNPTLSPSSLTNSNIRQYISSWMNNLEQSFIDKNTNNQIFDNNWNSWWTEVSVGRTDNNSNYPTWGHALAQAYACIWLQEKGAQLVMFGNLNSPRVTAKSTGELRGTGWALQPLMLASKDKTKVRKMDFLSYDTDKKIKGIVFHNDSDDASSRNVCVINLTNESLEVDLSNVFPGQENVALQGVKQNDLNSTANPVEILTRSESTKKLNIDAFSVNLIKL